MIWRKFIKEKGGDIQQIQFFIIYIVFAVVVFISLLYFTNSSLTFEGSKSRILAKEVALLIDFAKPGTEIKIEVKGFIVSLNDRTKEITVRAENKPLGYSYNYFNSNMIELSKNGDILIIRILK